MSYTASLQGFHKLHWKFFISFSARFHKLRCKVFISFTASYMSVCPVLAVVYLFTGVVRGRILITLFNLTEVVENNPVYSVVISLEVRKYKILCFWVVLHLYFETKVYRVCSLYIEKQRSELDSEWVVAREPKRQKELGYYNEWVRFTLHTTTDYYIFENNVHLLKSFKLI